MSLGDVPQPLTIPPYSEMQASSAPLPEDELRAIIQELQNIRVDARSQSSAVAASLVRVVALLRAFEADGMTVKTDADTPLQVVVV